MRLAAVGAGYFSQFHYRAWSRIAGIEIVGICDRDAAAASRAATAFSAARTYTHLETMLDTERPDLLDIIIPPAGHLDAICAAASRGIHMICQKPFCGGLAAAEQATRFAEEAGVKLIIHENIRFQPWYAKLREVLAGAQLGQVFGATFRLRPGDGQGRHAYLDRQPYFREMPRFVVHETGVHYVDLFRSLFGEVKAVTARLRRLNPVIAGEDAGLVILEMRSGAVAVLDANRLSDHVAINRRLTLGEMIVEGEGGALSVTGDGEVLLRRLGENTVENLLFDWEDRDFGGDCVYHTQLSALAAIRGAAPTVNSAREYLPNLRIEEAIYASDSERCRIELN